ncbi:hypothetical protein EV421DRAFT_1900069 [Armillaria borealis]|uniref:CxC2-like cysteine cluster KDZ transposase-associated domain-containing protein n=1 Tax=Armillaria borealis TaxID=47425 RepID=A0AA39MX72_9AGAR|nr:hypothetical protein EV421DRAFT_1900069 [Armillaria borealis]
MMKISDTLAKAAEVDSFSYTMGEDLSGMGAPKAPLDGDLDGIRVTARGKAQQNLENPMHTWIPLRGEYLDEFLCLPSVEHCAQLLRSSWYPATPLEPQTSTTFTLMRLFHTINCQGKLPAFDLWKSLEIMTSNRTHSPPPDRYKVLLWTIHQWCHLKQCKWASRGHNPTGIEGTAQGGLALDCPACPLPSKNIPLLGEIKDAKRWLYRHFFATDANFRTRNAIVSTEEKDPSLSDRWAYFVRKGLYMEHIWKHVTEEEISTCSGFTAVFLVNLKNIQGLCTTRMHGERYQCNVDGVIVQALNDVELEVVISYNVICQWGIHFWKRMQEFPDNAQLKITEDALIMCIPKFHIWAHQLECHTRFSFNYLLDAARMHSETIEENWANSNRAAAQTKMLGPSAREDTLDNIFSFHNFKTIESFGCMFTNRIVEAIQEARVHRTDFESFNKGLMRFCGPAAVKMWLESVHAWEKDHSKPCPYEAKLQGKVTLQEVELQLSREEYDTVVRGGGVLAQSSLSTFIFSGIQIEEAQQNLALEVKARAAGTIYQQLNIQKQRKSLGWRIQQFCGLQQLFMLNLHQALMTAKLQYIDGPSSFISKAIKLFMPSELDGDTQRASICGPGIAEAEMRVREAEARDLLQWLRQGLRNRSASHLFTVKNVTGQNPTSCNQGILHNIQMNIYENKLRYPYARNVLNKEDIHAVNEKSLTEEELHDQEHLRDLGLLDSTLEGTAGGSWSIAQLGEGHRRLSWIWYQLGRDDDRPAIHEALHIEWCKACARMLCWEEEVELLNEEMRRVLAYKEWHHSWWMSQLGMRTRISEDLQEGLTAYAYEHAVQDWSCASELKKKWHPLRKLAIELLEGLPITEVYEYEVEEDDISDDVTEEE